MTEEKKAYIEFFTMWPVTAWCQLKKDWISYIKARETDSSVSNYRITTN
jgi:hypothetical protein